MRHMSEEIKMLETTVAGSLPKPSWLAEPEKLWAPWRLEGKELEQGKRDAAPTVITTATDRAPTRLPDFGDPGE